MGSGCLAGEAGALSLHRRIDRYYPGTGDLFASVMLSALLNDAKLRGRLRPRGRVCQGLHRVHCGAADRPDARRAI